MTALSNTPDITMIICTRNRAAQLGSVLDSATRLRTPDGLVWEFLIIDNGSTDATAEVAASYQDRLPIRLVRENQAGLSNARNRGVAEAAGQYICWTDDDVVLDPEWLAAYWAAFKRHPEAAIFGGRIEPILQAPTPAWFEKLRGEWPVNVLLAMRDFGDEPSPLDFSTGRIPFGANFAIKTTEQRKVGYDPGLGVSPNHRRVGEEAEAIFRLMSGGALGWWVPAAKVGHIITPQRQSWDYIYDYAQSYGETLAYMERVWPGAHHLASSRDKGRVNAAPVELLLRAALYHIASRVARLAGSKRRAAQFLATAGLFAGANRFANKANETPNLLPGRQIPVRSGATHLG